MSEYIKREDARESIARLHGGCITDDVKTFVDYTLLSVPSADVVEVVRCKDCKHRYEYATNITGDIKHYYICDFLDAENKDNGYCSCGERKEKG